MDKKFEEIITKLLEKNLNEIVFIELKPGKKLNVPGFNTPDNFVLPVYIQDLAEKIKSNDIDNIPVIAIIKGLVYAIGTNAKLNFIEAYKQILSAIDDGIVYNIVQDGLRLAEEKKYSSAILYFNATLALDPENIDAFYNMGRAFEDLSEKEERTELKRLAKYCYEKCVAIDPEFSLAYYSLGITNYNEANYLSAEENWLKALSFKLPDGIKAEIATGLGRVRDRAVFERGYNYILDGRINDGLELLKSLEDFHDEWWDLLFYIGLGNRMLEQYEDALKYFLKVMTLNTGHIQTMNEIGICFLALGDYAEAEKHYKEAMRLSPDNAELICNMGIVKFYKGEIAEALTWVERAMALSPDDEVTHMWLNHIQQHSKD